MTALTDALEAYSHGVACGVDDLELACRFADLTAAHRAWVGAADLTVLIEDTDRPATYIHIAKEGATP